MMDCNEIAPPVHSRRPVLLHEEDYHPWLRGSLDEVLELQRRCFPDELTAMERAGERWFRRGNAKAVAAE